MFQLYKKWKSWEDACLCLVLVCISLCHCSTFYTLFFPHLKKKPNHYVLLLDISPNHSTYRTNSSSSHQILTLYSPLSTLIFPLWQENVPCSNALWCQNERLLAGWAKEYLTGNFQRTSSDCIVITSLKKWRETPLHILTCDFHSAASRIIQSRKYCWFEGQPSALILFKSSPAPDPHPFWSACFLWHLSRSETGQLL